MKTIEYILIDNNNLNDNKYINFNINKEIFNNWFSYYNRSSSKINRIYKKTMEYRYSIIQENIQPKIYHSVIENKEQNYINYIQKYNEYNEDILIPNIRYQYEYLNNPSFIYKQNKYPFLHCVNNTEIVENEELQYHINEPTDIYEINEIIFNCNTTERNNDLSICFSIVKDLYTNKDNTYYWIKLLENSENSSFYRYIIPNLLV